MPSPTPIPVREAIYQRWQQGQASSEIAEALNLAVRTVRHLIQRFREKGSEAISTSYHHAGAKMSAAQQEVRDAAEEMRREHPGWGSIVIRIMLLKQAAGKLLPTARTFRRWFAQSGLGPAAKGERPASTSFRAERPHQVWQMDASEEIALKDGSRGSWLRIVDEYTGAVLMTRVFSEARFNSVDPQLVQQCIRDTMMQWGKPEHFRVDNGFPWGSSGDLPTDLALWIIGLGIGMIWNPPRQPEKNGVVERSQGTGKRWAEPKQCDSLDELQEHIDRMDRLQREDYPRPGGGSRMELFPDLLHSGRGYAPETEMDEWDWQRIGDHLSGYTVTRRVDSSGLSSIYNRLYYVGRNYYKQTVYVSFDPTTGEWLFRDERGLLLRAHRAKELEADRIISLEVTHRRDRGKTQMSDSTAKPDVR